MISSFAILTSRFKLRSDLIVGHNDYIYKVDKTWGQLNPQKVPVTDCHEMVCDKKGRVILLTNNVKNNLIYYDTQGNLIKTVVHNFPGAHGLTICDEGGEEFLYVTDTIRNAVYKLNIEGRILFELPFPQDSGKYKSKADYLPTETAIASNGDIYVADGYGLQFIIHYDQQGNLKNVFGGKGEDENQFFNAHGIAIDNRNGKDKLLISARMKNQLKYFNLDGDYIESIDLPGAYVCRPVIKNGSIYLATIWTDNGESNSGVLSILDENNRLVSQPGGLKPLYSEGQLSRIHQSIRLFKHPHDVCVDKDENLYVAQWNAGQVYPFKLIRV